MRRIRMLRLSALLLLAVVFTLCGCERFTGVVDFEAGPNTGTIPLTVRFTPIVEGRIRSWVWDFGDGTTSTESSPEHVYTQPGAYTVLLLVDPRRGEPAATRKDDYIRVGPLVGLTQGSLESQADEVELDSDSFPVALTIDVLANDSTSLPDGKLKVIQLRGMSMLESSCIDTDCGWSAEIISAGAAILYTRDSRHSSWSADSTCDLDWFEYLVTDGEEEAWEQVEIVLAPVILPPHP